MSLSIHQIIQERSTSLLTQFHKGFVSPCVAARDLQRLAGQSSWPGGTIERISDRSRASRIWRFDDPHASSLWVRPASKARGEYKRFIDKLYGDVDWSDFDRYEVDHLFNRARAFSDDTMLRVEAIDRHVNNKHAAFERANTSSRYEVRDGREQRPMTFMSVLKVAGLVAPKSMSDGKAVDSITIYLSGQGWSTAEITHGLESLLAKSKAR